MNSSFQGTVSSRRPMDIVTCAALHPFSVDLHVTSQNRRAKGVPVSPGPILPWSAAIYLPAHEKLLLKSELQASSTKKFIKRIEFGKIKMWSFNIAVADTCQGDKRNILDSKNSARTVKYYFKNTYYFD